VPLTCFATPVGPVQSMYTGSAARKSSQALSGFTKTSNAQPSQLDSNKPGTLCCAKLCASSTVQLRNRWRKAGTALKSVENLRLNLSISIDVSCNEQPVESLSNLVAEQPSGRIFPRHAAQSQRQKTRLCEISPEGRARKRLRKEVDEDLCAIASRIQLSSIPFADF
jgi:hypothetical protein